MESESESSAKARPSTRRNKIVHQTERDKNQENIDDSLKEAKGLNTSQDSTSIETPTAKNTSIKVEDKQTSTPNVNSSTPRSMSIAYVIVFNLLFCFILTFVLACHCYCREKRSLGESAFQLESEIYRLRYSYLQFRQQWQ